MPFEPELPAPFSSFFSGTINTAVIDTFGNPASTIISMQDSWTLQVVWNLSGTLVPSIGGKWQVRAYLESLGPGPEMLIANRTVNMDGSLNYAENFVIGPGEPNTAGAYKLVTVLTSTNLLGAPAPFAAYDEGGILQFFEGHSI